MTSPLDSGNRWCVLGVTVFALSCLAAIAARSPALALVNESPSLPKGLYLREPGATVGRGDTVAIPQPPTVQAYLAKLGMPKDVVLIKRVAALPGDRVCRQENSVVVGNRTASVQDHDRQGAVLPAWRGCRRLLASEIFLLGDTAGSFDSRYFGPVNVNAVTGVYREVLTW